MPGVTKTQSANHEVPIEYGLIEKHKSVSQYSCDMCGQLTLAHRLTPIDEYLYLCPSCFRHVDAVSEKDLKESLTRMLLGNVL